MPATLKTYIYCLDDHRTFTEDLKKKFDDPSRYVIFPFQSGQELARKFAAESDRKVCRIVIIGMQGSGFKYEDTSSLVSDVRKSDPGAGVILLCPADRLDEISGNVRIGIDAYIPHNANSVLRIHNTVKKFFSGHTMNLIRKRRNRSLAVLAMLLFLSLVALVLGFLEFPQYF